MMRAMQRWLIAMAVLLGLFAFFLVERRVAG